jgi:hypothetical protein
VNYDDEEWKRIEKDGISGISGQPGVPDRYTSGGQEFHEIVKTLWNPAEFECAWVSRKKLYLGVCHNADCTHPVKVRKSVSMALSSRPMIDGL